MANTPPPNTPGVSPDPRLEPGSADGMANDESSPTSNGNSPDIGLALLAFKADAQTKITPSQQGKRGSDPSSTDTDSPRESQSPTVERHVAGLPVDRPQNPSPYLDGSSLMEEMNQRQRRVGRDLTIVTRLLGGSETAALDSLVIDSASEDEAQT
ncbi:hypothetical protein ABW20_dc0102859 [Dactylellina cionopaga]|nr:hypothetical protein ABW20_dc0102859 [Dactylellina cionopaga]